MNRELTWWEYLAAWLVVCGLVEILHAAFNIEPTIAGGLFNIGMGFLIIVIDVVLLGRR